MARLLVVDHNPDVRDVLETYLAGDGHAVSSARAPDEALPLLDGGAFDVLVVDVVLPELSALELVKNARVRGTRVLIMSGDPNSINQLASDAAHGRRTAVTGRPRLS